MMADETNNTPETQVDATAPAIADTPSEAADTQSAESGDADALATESSTARPSS